MVTIGGIFVDNSLETKICNSDLFNEYEYLSIDEEAFTIEIPQLTSKEAQLLLKSIPITEEEYKEKIAEFHGIEYDEINKFAKIYRYYPFYHESKFIV